MKITVNILERNPRNSGIAVLNGVTVEVTGADPMTGSEKQVAWAEDIRCASIRMLAEKAIAKLAGSANGTIYQADKLDAALERVNTEFCPMIVSKIEGITSARDWIDYRGMDAARVAQMVDLK